MFKTFKKENLELLITPLKKYKNKKLIILLQKLKVILYYNFKFIKFKKTNIGNKLEKYYNIIKLNFVFLFRFFWLFI